MIEPLPIEFKSHQRAFRQLARRGIVALYEVRDLRHYLIGFELIIIRYQKPYLRDTWSYPERERYPFNREFGRYAWSFPVQTRETAELAFDFLATMPFGSVKPCANKDNYLGWTRRAGPRLLRQSLLGSATGRSLPNRQRRSNSPTNKKPN